MNKPSNLTIVVGLICSIALLLVVIIAVNAPQPIPNTNTQPSYGGTSPEISSPYLQVNGVRQWFVTVPTANLTSSTLCSMRSPAATTTLQSASVRILGANTAESVNWVYKAATASATTTALFGGVTIAAAEQGTFMATTTTDNFVIAPSQYIVVDTSANYAQTGWCNAVFTEI